MKNLKFLLFLFLLFPLYYLFGDKLETNFNIGSAHQEDPIYELAWSDEFNQESRSYDKSKWIVSWWHKSCENSQAVAYCEDGNLVLKAIKNPDTKSDRKYLCGCVQTKKKAEFLYGKMEVRAKFSHAKGSWPAIWFCPSDTVYGAWPKSGEIDLMEHLSLDSFVIFTAHSEDRRLNKTGTPHWSGSGKIDVNEYNTYTLLWEKDKLSFCVNDNVCFEYPKITEMGSDEWPYDIPFYLLLNMVLGGWAGEIDESALPFEMKVDWVRYYKKVD